MQIAVGCSFRPKALTIWETRRVHGKWSSFLTNPRGLHDASVPTVLHDNPCTNPLLPRREAPRAGYFP
jgi:hypothetical protein